MINKLIEDHGHGLFQEESDYLTYFKHNTSYFYGLPKIHKSTMIITEAIKQQNSEYIKVFQPCDLKFRPIVGGPNNPTQRLSHILDDTKTALSEGSTIWVGYESHGRAAEPSRKSRACYNVFLYLFKRVQDTYFF